MIDLGPAWHCKPFSMTITQWLMPTSNFGQICNTQLGTKFLPNFENVSSALLWLIILDISCVPRYETLYNGINSSLLTNLVASPKRGCAIEHTLEFTDFPHGRPTVPSLWFELLLFLCIHLWQSILS